MDILKYCKREEADPQYMWDLSALYKTEEEFEKAVKTIDLMQMISRKIMKTNSNQQTSSKTQWTITETSWLI